MKYILFCWSFLVLQSTLFAQSVNLEWSKLIPTSNKSGGFCRGAIGDNSKYIYMDFGKIDRAKKPKGDLRVVAIDKETMKQLPKSADVISKKDKESANEKYWKSAVFEDVIFVFSTSNSKDVESTYATTLTSELEVVAKRKKVWESNTKKGNATESFVVYNTKATDIVVIGNETVDAENNVKAVFKVLDKELEMKDMYEVELPVQRTARSAGLSSSYKLLENGKLLISTSIRVENEEEGKKKKSGPVGSYVLLTFVDLSNGSKESISVRSEGKSMFDVNVVSEGSDLLVLGFYNDEVKTTGEYTSTATGTFYAKLNSRAEVVSTVFNPFTPELIEKAYRSDKTEKENEKAKKKNSKNKAKAEKEEEPSAFVGLSIMRVEKVSDGMIVIASRESNYTVTYNTNNGSYTVPYCNLRDIVVYKLDKSGNQVWNSFHPRNVRYRGWYHNDVDIAPAGANKFIITYGNLAEYTNSGTKAKEASGNELYTALLVDADSGMLEPKPLVFNKGKVEKALRKTISENDGAIIRAGNDIFVVSQSMYMGTGATVLSCIGCIICLPSFFFTFNNPTLQKGNFSLGKLVVEQ